jgi:phosphosulfolactate phosphohydrolase-like enzyme
VQVEIVTPGQITQSADPTPDIVVVIDVLRATSTAVVLSDRTSDGILLVPRPAMLPSLPKTPVDYLVFSELTSEGFERVDNSPSRAETIELRGRTPVLVTTNGTIATNIAHQHGKTVMLASFLNVSAVAEAIRSARPSRVLIVPAGRVKDDSRCQEDDQCALAIMALLKGERVDLQQMADECRNAPLIVQRLIDEDGLLVDVDYSLRVDTSKAVLYVTEESENVFRIHSQAIGSFKKTNSSN